MPGGRPTKLTEELREKARAYLDVYTTIVPTLEGFSLYLGITTPTMYDWRDKDPEFSSIMDNIMRTKARELQEMGLKGETNPTITKLLLSKHGYSDKVEQDITSGGQRIVPLLGGASVQGHDSNEETT